MPGMSVRTRFVHCGVAACVGIVAMHTVDAQPIPVRTATLMWRVDGTESGEPFGDVRDYVMLKDGTVWALDFKDQIIRRYDVSGKPLPVVGRKGSGPGEMRNANGLAVAPNGSVWVNDPSNGRFSVFAASGALERAVTVPSGGYAYRWGAWFDTPGELIEMSFGRQAGYRRVSTNGNVLGSIAAPDCPSGPRVPQSFRAETPGSGSTVASYPFTTGGGSVADRRGHFWCASPFGSRVARLAYGRSDTLARTSRDIPPIDVSRAERDDAIQRAEARVARYATNDFDRANVPTTKPGMAALYVDDDGRLWVVHSTPWKQNRTTYDVFNASGMLLFRVELPVRTSSYLPVIARGNELVVATLDDDDVVGLARYRLR